MIRVQREDFDAGVELDSFCRGDTEVGAVATFLGLVRGQGGVAAMSLEHYPGMTERQLEAIEAEARRRWPLNDVLVIHRYGRLEAGDRIV
ncbi:MAG: molybdenum cofactor biosynthesis protein MoaE, partial [Rhodospirillales bacterium]|nr:molybdenum cofactor biosynthesis protein MoaE [Rhodospirillales bacterium]